jgi:glycosyltransferase involved in cell wall biosynthesis
MKIAFNMVSATHGGGFQTYNQNILNRLLTDKNHKSNEIFIFTNDKSYKTDNKQINLIYISNFFSITLYRLFWMQFILPIYLIYFKVDTLFSPMNIMPIIVKLFKIKTILVVHSNLPWLFPNDMPGNKAKLFIQKFIMNYSINFADRIIVDSRTAKNELYNIFSKISNKIETIYLGAEGLLQKLQYKETIFIDNLDITNEEYFLTISSAVPYHCLIELIIAYNKICENKNAIPKYLIISKKLDSNYFNKLKNIIKNSKFSEKIILIEDLESKFLPEIYKNSNLYIFSSYCEVFGLTNLEAMNYGVPVVTSNRSSLPEICGEAAIYSNPEDPEDIKNKVSELYFDKKLKDKMIENGYNNVKKYSWDNTFEKTLKTIYNV